MSSIAFSAPIPVPRISKQSIDAISRRPLVCARVANPGCTFDIATFSDILYESQKSLCSKIETLDGGSTFCHDPWTREDGSGGLTRVLQAGSLFEKAGVNVSVVTGILSETRAATMRSRGRNCNPGVSYHAAALSFVLHAQSPFIPTLRGDVRIFATGDEFWAGGGVDLTICYLDRKLIADFHRYWKAICDEFDDSYYPQFKKQCDDYFYLPSRGEHRGVGGLFYDDLVLPQEQLFAFQQKLLSEFIPSFMPILNANRYRDWTEEQKRWQRIRRGRYLEFNLLEDRGVRFGLAGAKPTRTDSILISAPPSVDWPYGHVPPESSAEKEVVELLSGPPLAWAEL